MAADRQFDWQTTRTKIIADLKATATGRKDLFYSVDDHLEARSVVNKLISIAPHASITEGGNALIKFLASPMQLQRGRRAVTKIKGFDVTSGPATETDIKHDRVDFLMTNLPDVIFIAGNNDLTQIQDTLLLLAKLKERLILNRVKPDVANTLICNIPIVISGKGEHGVAPGPIFATTEATAMAEFFQENFSILFGSKHPNIITENLATNSGQNVDFTKPMMRKIEAHAKAHFVGPQGQQFRGIRILLVPTPVGGVRQLATVCQQAENETEAKIEAKEVTAGGKGYQVASVYMLPDHKKIMNAYFFDANRTDACINLLAALREVVNHVGYLLDNDFMTPHAPNGNRLKAALEIVFYFYEKLTNDAVNDPTKLINDINAFAIIKQARGGITDLSQSDQQARVSIKARFDNIKGYFQATFNQVERQHMEYLADKDAKLSAANQERLIRSKKYKQFFAAMGVDPALSIDPANKPAQQLPPQYKSSGR